MRQSPRLRLRAGLTAGAHRASGTPGRGAPVLLGHKVPCQGASCPPARGHPLVCCQAASRSQRRAQTTCPEVCSCTTGAEGRGVTGSRAGAATSGASLRAPAVLWLRTHPLYVCAGHGTKVYCRRERKVCMGGTAWPAPQASSLRPLCPLHVAPRPWLSPRPPFTWLCLRLLVESLCYLGLQARIREAVPARPPHLPAPARGP